MNNIHYLGLVGTTQSPPSKVTLQADNLTKTDILLKSLLCSPCHRQLSLPSVYKDTKQRRFDLSHSKGFV